MKALAPELIPEIEGDSFDMNERDIELADDGIALASLEQKAEAVAVAHRVKAPSFYDDALPEVECRLDVIARRRMWDDYAAACAAHRAAILLTDFAPDLPGTPFHLPPEARRALMLADADLWRKAHR